MEPEVWKECPGFYDKIEVSDRGGVRRNGNTVTVPIGTNSKRVFITTLEDGRRTSVTVARLVYEAFIGKPGKTVQHKNGKSWDDRAVNLYSPAVNEKRALAEREAAKMYGQNPEAYTQELPQVTPPTPRLTPRPAPVPAPVPMPEAVSQALMQRQTSQEDEQPNPIDQVDVDMMEAEEEAYQEWLRNGGVNQQ